MQQGRLPVLISVESNGNISSPSARTRKIEEDDNKQSVASYVNKKSYVCCWPFSLCCYKKRKHRKEATQVEEELSNFASEDTPRMIQ